MSGPLAGEIDYTLRVFPNHPRALPAMMRLAQRDGNPKPRGANWPAECYLERAIQFRPDDMNVRQVRGIYFSSQRRYQEAIAEFAQVIQQQPNNANAIYNLGLMQFETKDFEGALESAKRAKTLGFPLGGLQTKLKTAGRWRE